MTWRSFHGAETKCRTSDMMRQAVCRTSSLHFIGEQFFGGQSTWIKIWMKTQQSGRIPPKRSADHVLHVLIWLTFTVSLSIGLIMLSYRYQSSSQSCAGSANSLIDSHRRVIRFKRKCVGTCKTWIHSWVESQKILGKKK